MRQKFDFFIRSFGLYLQTRYDGWYTSMIWYTRKNGKTNVVEKSTVHEDYDAFINRVAKIKMVNP